MIPGRKRHFSLHHTIAFFGVAVLILAPILIGGGGDLFFNVPALMITYGLTFFLLLGNFGNAFLKFIPDSILTLVSRPTTPIPLFAEIARFGSRYVIGAGLIGTLIGFIQMLSGMSDPSSIGAGMATSLLTTFYAIIASEVFFAFLYKAYSGNEEGSGPLLLKNIGIPVVILAWLVITFFTMLLSFSDYSGMDHGKMTEMIHQSDTTSRMHATPRHARGA